MWTKKAIKNHQLRDMANSDNKLFLKPAHAVSVSSYSFNQLANNYRILRGASIQRHINLTYAYVIDSTSHHNKFQSPVCGVTLL